jgi:glycogen debranching enzyme
MTEEGRGGLEAGPSLQFYIPATSSLLERRPRTLKHGPTFALFDHYGDVLAAPRSPEGLFHDDTRHLSSWQLEIEGRRPLLLSSTIRDDNLTLSVDLTNPDIYDGDRLALLKDTVHLTRAVFLVGAACHERICLHNFGGREQPLRLRLRFAADFADLFDIRGYRRQRRGTIEARLESPREARFLYTGPDGVTRQTSIEFDPAPAELTPDAAAFDLVLPPKGRLALFVRVDCAPAAGRAAWNGQRFFRAYRSARASLRAATARAATVATSHELLNELLCRSTADIFMLLTDTAEGPYPYAGIPWFATVFGRDGIITAMELLWIDPEIARGVLRFLAANQATETDPNADAEPGKILHELREGELARLGEVPFRRYYGSVDSTPLFVMLAGMYVERTGDLATLRAIWPNILAALEWIDRYGDADGDGFVEYGQRAHHGLANQGWKDSHDAVFTPEGELAEPPIALVEVQAYAYAAKRHAADLARLLAEYERADGLDAQAERLRARFEETFWSPELDCYALALDGRKRRLDVLSSNAGHALFAGIAAPDRAAAVAERLLGPDFFSGWGVRTIARGEARYNPMSYHNGSVWPHDNALIAWGLARYGLVREAMKVFEGLLHASTYVDLARLPELLCGLKRQARKGPTFYPVACAPQAWAAAAPFALLWACLGLSFDVPHRRVRLDRPRLPAFLDRVVIRNLGIADGSLDLVLHRYGGDVAAHVLRRRGDVRLEVEL